MWHCSAGWICEVCCECLFQFEKLAETTDKEAGSAEREEDCNSSVSSQLSGMCLDIPVQTKYTNANCYECFYSFLLCVNVHVFTKVCGWRGKKSFFPLRSHCVSIYTVSQKTVRIVFGITLSNFHQLWWFLAKKPSWYYYVRCTHLPPHLIYVSALLCQHLPCETQMLQIVTLCSDYLYQMAHLCIISSTEGVTWFNNFEVLNIFVLKTAGNKIAGWWA